MPIDPRTFALTSEGRNAERLADLERHQKRAQATSLNRVSAVAYLDETGLWPLTSASADVLEFTGSPAADTAGMWDPAHPSRLTAQFTGFYLAACRVEFGTNPTNDRAVTILGTNFPEIGLRAQAPATTGWIAAPCGPALLDAGDFVELEVWQNSGTTVNVVAWSLSLALVGAVA